MYPSKEAIEKLHRTYAPSDELFDLVFTHCTIVNEIAEELIKEKQLQLNKELVYAGAMLHDIATYKYFALAKEHGEVEYYRHAYEGGQILRKEGVPEDICSLVEHHLGVGLSKEEILKRKMNLPAKDFLPKTIEERLVMYADKFHSKTPKFNAYESYRAYAATFGKDNETKFEKLVQEFGIPDIEKLAAKYHHPVV